MDLIPRKTKEKCFTLLETIIALGLMVTMILEVSSAQGNAINFSDYGRKLTQALWLSRSIMSEIEYKSKFYPIKEISLGVKEQEFDEKLCPKEPECEFRYDLTIEKWDLPIVDLAISGMGASGEDGEEKQENPFSSMIKDQMKNILGEEIIKVAHVEVSWPEGAKRNSVELAYLFANQKGVDDFIETLQPVGLAASTPVAVTCKEGEVLRNGACEPSVPGAGKVVTPPAIPPAHAQPGGTEEGDI